MFFNIGLYFQNQAVAFIPRNGKISVIVKHCYGIRNRAMPMATAPSVA